jgi:hypothetical protein
MLHLAGVSLIKLSHARGFRENAGIPVKIFHVLHQGKFLAYYYILK